jgi:DNA-directed RNA polymerase specialized sigma24 family protein
MPALNDRLSAMNTCWQQVRAASLAAAVARDDQDYQAVQLAQWELLERYGGAVQRYLLGAVHDEDLAQELAQDFAIEFLKGACKGADPARGRFRDFVKGIAQHLVANHFRKRKKLPGHLPTDHPEAAEPQARAGEATFIDCWRDQLLSRAWQALSNLEQQTGQPYHAVLKHKADHPDESSEQMAGAMSQQLQRPLNAPAVRKALQRAREKFAGLLLADLSASLGEPGQEALVQELIDLRLYEYCRPALERKQQ